MNLFRKRKYLLFRDQSPFKNIRFYYYPGKDRVKLEFSSEYDNANKMQQKLLKDTAKLNQYIRTDENINLSVEELVDKLIIKIDELIP